MEVLENRVVLTQLAIGLFDTGVDSSGNALTVGQQDSHYTLPVNPNGTAGANAVVTSTVSGWAANSSTDAWIAPASSQGDLASGSYTYETTFDVDSAGQVQLTGTLAGDNYIHDVLIDGVSTGYNQPQAGTAFVPFNVAGAGRRRGPTLWISSSPNSSGATTGFHAKGLTLDYIPTVAVNSPTVSVGYGGTATLSGTFNDIDAGDTVTITSTRGSISTVGTNTGTFTYTESNVTTGGPGDDHRDGQPRRVDDREFPAQRGAAVAHTRRGWYGHRDGRWGGRGGRPERDAQTTPTAPTSPRPRSPSAPTSPPPRTACCSPTRTASPARTAPRPAFSRSADRPPQRTTRRRYGRSSTRTSTPTPATVNQAPRTVSFSIAPGTYNPANGHFYNFVRNPGITWTNAKAAADATSLYGMKGYLATLTSAAENTFAFSKTLSTGWIGASDAGNVGHWAWADGPENGLQFWQGLGNGAPVNGQYNDWNSGEPNDSGGVEFYAQYLSNGLWNDLSNTASVNGYLIEYGGSVGDPTLQLTSQATVNVVAITSTPHGRHAGHRVDGQRPHLYDPGQRAGRQPRAGLRRHQQ